MAVDGRIPVVFEHDHRVYDKYAEYYPAKGKYLIETTA